MKKIIGCLLAAAMMLGLCATPASASLPPPPGLCTNSLTDVMSSNVHWINAGSIGEVAVCFGFSDMYSDMTLWDPRFGTLQFQVRTHDWTNDGVSIYVQYQVWGDGSWYVVPGSTDAYGGPATISEPATLIYPQQVKYVRVVSGAKVSYLFRPRTGAGSGNGCGLEGETAHDGMIACPAGSY